MAQCLLCVLLFASMSAAQEMITINGHMGSIQVSAPEEDLEVMTVNCTVQPGVSGLTNIEVGNRLMYTGRYSETALATIGPDGHIRTLTNRLDIKTVGYLDSTGPTPSYLSVSINSPTCSDQGVYYCKATNISASALFRDETNVTLCSNISQVTHRIPDTATPTHNFITCHFAANHDIGSISFVQISWQKMREPRQPLAYASASEDGGLAVLAANFSGSNLRVSGRINQTHPEYSQVVVEFPSETCETAAIGTFSCLFRYSYTNSSTSQVTRSQLMTSGVCDDSFPGIWISPRNQFYPTSFSVRCVKPPRPPYAIVSLELSLIPDNSPLVRRQIAYLDSLSQDTRPTVSGDLEKRGVTGENGTSSNEISLLFGAGTCADTGVYRCSAVYQLSASSDQSLRLKVSEARLPACAPGALATVENSNTSDGRWTEKFVCRVDPALVLELVSLEVSVLRLGSRQVLAYINRFFNGAKVTYTSEEVSADGEIYPSNPAASSLNVTSSLQTLERTSLYTATCRVTFSSKQDDRKALTAIAEGQIRLRE